MVLLSVLFGIIQFGLIIYILYKEVERKSPAMFLWATLFLMFGFPHLITVILSDIEYKESTILKASIFVTVFCVLYLIVRHKKKIDFIDLSGKKGFRIDNDEITYSVFETLCFVFLIVSAIATLIGSIKAQGGIMNTSWASGIAIERGYVNYQALLSRLIYMVSGLSLYYFLTNRKDKAAVVLLIQLLMVIISRNRVQTLPIFIFFITLYLLKMRRILLKHIVFGVFVAASAIYILYAIRAFRWLGSLSDAISNVSFEYINSMVIRFIKDKSGEMGLRQWFYFFIENNNDFEGFNRGYSYIRMLMVYIPSRFSLGLKPSSFDIYMGEAIGMETGSSMHPTLFGDCFANLNWLGVLLGVFWAAFANVFDNMISKKKNSFHKILIFFMISYSYVVIGRGSVYNGFEGTAWGVLILYLMDISLYRFKEAKVKWRFMGKFPASNSEK